MPVDLEYCVNVDCNRRRDRFRAMYPRAEMHNLTSWVSLDSGYRFVFPEEPNARNFVDEIRGLPFIVGIELIEQKRLKI